MASPNKAGDRIKKSGIYSVVHEGQHAETHEATCLAGLFVGIHGHRKGCLTEMSMRRQSRNALRASPSLFHVEVALEKVDRRRGDLSRIEVGVGTDT